jgi:NAD(P)-dependent dehydrogenase (short-subunit alcohol dehydrogenase family)
MGAVDRRRRFRRLVAELMAVGTVSVITGGAGGIGAAIADGLAGRGDDVVVIDVSRQRSAYPAMSADVRDPAAIAAAFDDIERQYGPIGALVNCAGVMSRQAALATSEAEWAQVIGINLTGTYVCCVEAARRMVPRGRGWVVNIGSIWAKHVWPMRAAYSASKAGVEQFTRCLAIELASHGVRVNCISPGIMDTPFTAAVMHDQAFQQSFMSRVALHEAGDPCRDLVELTTLLTSEASHYMVGEVITSYGGYY